MDRSPLGRWLTLTLVLLAALLLPATALLVSDERPDASRLPAVAGASHPPLFFDEAAFLEALRGAESVAQPEGRVVGGIVPHHLLPGHLITGFFRGLAAADATETVILIGPNHDNEGRARALTSTLPWETPFGAAEPDLATIRALTEAGLVAVEDSVLTTEHSVAGIMPALEYYLPDAKVVPLILSGELTPVEAQRLGEALAALARDGTVIVAAVDFSHALIRSQAEEHDAVTLEALRSANAGTLFTLDNRYLDSPPSIATLMAAMRALGASDFVLLENTNSGALLNDQLTPTTSYIMGYYREGAFSSERSGRPD